MLVIQFIVAALIHFGLFAIIVESLGLCFHVEFDIPQLFALWVAFLYFKSMFFTGNSEHDQKDR